MIDDDATIRTIVQIGVEKVPDTQCITAADGKEGLEIVRNRRVDFLITDLQMPEMDGITFLSHIMEEFPQIPRAVMTSMGETSRSYASLTGVIAVIPKPIDVGMLTNHLEKWLETYRIHTYTEGVDLSSILQLIELDRKTCTVGVQDMVSGRIGLLHIVEGSMNNAVAGDLTGIDAAMCILMWPDVRLWIHNLTVSTDAVIDVPMQSLLLNAACARDEGSDSDKMSAVSEKEQKIPTAKWIREHKPDDLVIDSIPGESDKKSFDTTVVNLKDVSALSDSIKKTDVSNEQSTEKATVSVKPPPFSSKKYTFLEKISNHSEESGSVKEVEKLFDKAIDAFKNKDYENSRNLWMKAEQLSPGHPVIKQNLKIISKYLG